MACDCEKKKGKCPVDFTKSVIEINNPEQLILLRKVVIPASLPEAENPPVIGRYRNVILKYENTGNVYIYSSDGIPTAIEANVPQAILDRIADLEEEDTVLHNDIATVSADLGTETLARENADIALSTAISAETSARGAADTTLQNNINALDNSISAVGKSNDYNDLDNRPTIGAGVITFTENNIVKGTFSANQTANSTIEFPVPTQTSELVNNGADGTSTYIEADELPTVDTSYDSSSSNAIANSTVTNSLDRQVMTNLAISSNPSTTVVNLNSTKTNLASPSSSVTSSISLPVASGTQAGVMNSAMYEALTKNTQDIASIVGEVVAISNLPADPTQAQLTSAWMAASGQPQLINGASIYDVTNEKRWTYYSNDTTWYALDATGSVTVNPWTNSAAGIVKGSTNVGQIFAEDDGTGSVNGWDTLVSTVDNHTSKLATIAQGAEVNVQSDWTQTNTSADDYIKNKPTNLVQDAAYVHTDNNFTTTLKDKLDGIAAGAEVNVQPDWDQTTTTADDYIKNKPTIPTVNNATLTIQSNGTTVNTFTANASSNVTANIPSATTSRYGVAKLSDSVVSTSTALAATANAAHEAFQNGAFYGTCDTAAATAAKEVTCSNFVLTAGAHITVRFTAANTAANATLNVNGTGARAIYLRGNPVGSGAWEAYDVVDFVYDSSLARWHMVGGPASILYGTSAPSSSLGQNGDIYVRYSA